jgi:hypothetical protein
LDYLQKTRQVALFSLISSFTNYSFNCKGNFFFVLFFLIKKNQKDPTGSSIIRSQFLNLLIFFIARAIFI